MKSASTSWNKLQEGLLLKTGICYYPNILSKIIVLWSKTISPSRVLDSEYFTKKLMQISSTRMKNALQSHLVAFVSVSPISTGAFLVAVAVPTLQYQAVPLLRVVFSDRC